MQINIFFNKNSAEQAETIRQAWYSTTSSNQTRDAFIFNECIDHFEGDPTELLDYLEEDEENETIQRKVTIKSQSNEVLKSIAAAINKPVSTTYRAIIAYTIDHLSDTKDKEKTAETAEVSRLLKAKIALMEKTLQEIKELIK